MLIRTPSVRSQKLPPAIAASATTLSRLIAASANMMTTAAERKSCAPARRPAASAADAASCSAHVEGDDQEHPGADELHQRHAEQRIGEEEHRQPEHDRPGGAEQTARRVSSGSSRPHAIAMTMALSAPSSRSTKKICKSRKSEAAMSVIGAPALRTPCRARPQGFGPSAARRRPPPAPISGAA